jgi:hypothetical protein
LDQLNVRPTESGGVNFARRDVEVDESWHKSQIAIAGSNARLAAERLDAMKQNR